MKVTHISCWCRMKVYSIQAFHLKRSVEDLMGEKASVVTSNCGCFYEGNLTSVFSSFFNYNNLLIEGGIKNFVKFPHFRAKARNASAISARGMYRRVVEPIRGILYSVYSKQSDIVHYHQGPDAFGFAQLSHFLKWKNRAKKVVTIHTFSALQKERPELNSIYNEVEAVITHTEHDKTRLEKWGVKSEKLHVIPYGATIKPLKLAPRDGVIMFAGSPLINVKGFEHLAPALRKLKEEGLVVPLKLHGYHMPGHKEWADGISAREGISEQVRWLSLSSEDDLIDAYQRSKICLIPYTDYPGSFPVTIAMANATPVIVSDLVGVAEYIREAGGVVTSTSVPELARVIRNLLVDEGSLKQHGEAGRIVAEKRFSWDEVSRKTIDVYRSII